MKLIVGLGNPGKIYQNTRHNLGANVILNLTKNLQLKPKFQAGIKKCPGRIYAASTTYMNESGLSVQKLVNFYKINLSDLYVVHDDLDLEVGEWKLQFDRGHAGHHGIESIIQHLGSQQFWRLRIGIGHPPVNIPVDDYVLKPFLSEEKEKISAVIDKIVREIPNL